jgi:hypothetical protein
MPEALTRQYDKEDYDKEALPKPRKHIQANFVEFVARATTPAHTVCENNHSLGFEKTPVVGCLVSGMIFDQTVRAGVAKATRRQKCLDMRNEPRAAAIEAPQRGGCGS